MYEYDSFGRLSKAETGGKKAEYSYDGNGVRRSKTTDGKTTGYYMAGDQVINETENGALSASNIIAGGVIGRITGGTSYMMLKNDHGDVVGLTTNGEVKADYTYSAYGELIAGESNGINNPIRYAGEYTDEESGLIYLRARYYDPGLGRFISEDTHWNPSNMIYGDNPDEDNPVPNMSAIMQSSNLFVYCVNNPVMLMDPSGMTMTLYGEGGDVYRIFQELQSLTNDTLVLIQLDFQVDLQDAYGVYILNEGYGSKSVGTELVRRIIGNQAYDCKIGFNGFLNGVSITKGDDGHGYMWYDENNVPHSGEGCGSKIELSYNDPIAVVEGGVEEVVPLNIRIGHELIHALRYMGGNFKDTGYFVDRSNGNTPYEEYETTGISYYDSNGNYVDCASWRMNENALRREQGKK